MVFSVLQSPTLSRVVLNWIDGDPTVGILVRRQDASNISVDTMDTFYGIPYIILLLEKYAHYAHLGICVSLQSRLFWEGLTISDLGIVPVQTVSDLHDLPKIRGFRGHPTKGGSRRPP